MPDFDVEYILTKLQSMGLVRLSKPLGEWYSIYCPFHSDGQEHKPSCGVSLVDIYRGGQSYPKGSFHCFACGAFYSLPDGISKILESHHINQSGYQWLVENIPGFDIDEEEFDYLIPQDTVGVLNSKYAMDYLKSINTQSQTYVSEEELASYRYTVPYMYERGLTDEIIEKYDIGVDMKFQKKGWKRPVPCITFPVRDKTGKTMYIVRRSIEGKAFYIPDDVEKPVYGVYELPKNCKSVDVVESVFNLTTCVKYGRPAVALLGTGNIKQRQELRTLGVQEYRLGLDPDDAGRKGTEKLKRDLKDVAIVWQYSGIPEGKDINDLSEKEFKNLELI